MKKAWIVILIVALAGLASAQTPKPKAPPVDRMAAKTGTIPPVDLASASTLRPLAQQITQVQGQIATLNAQLQTLKGQWRTAQGKALANASLDPGKYWISYSPNGTPQLKFESGPQGVRGF